MAIWNPSTVHTGAMAHGCLVYGAPMGGCLSAWIMASTSSLGPRCGSGDYFGTRELADRKGDGRIACVYIEREVVEGEGLT
jgi:hypothetical protein